MSKSIKKDINEILLQNGLSFIILKEVKKDGKYYCIAVDRTPVMTAGEKRTQIEKLKKILDKDSRFNYHESMTQNDTIIIQGR